MEYHKSYKGLNKLAEVKELKKTFLKRGYSLGYCEDMGLRMQFQYTEIHFIPETDRLRLCIHDDGMGEKETNVALELGAEIVLKYGYTQGTGELDGNGGFKESDDEYYKYF